MSLSRLGREDLSSVCIGTIQKAGHADRINTEANLPPVFPRARILS